MPHSIMDILFPTAPMNPPSSQSTEMPPTTLWLDVFPLETRSKVAWHVSSGKQNSDMLNLGMASPHQGEAVAEALSYTYNVDLETIFVAQQWAQIFKKSIRVFITHHQQAQLLPFYMFHLKPLFNAPTLREMHFFSSDRFIRLFVHGLRLKKATIYLKYSPPTLPSMDMLNSSSLLKSLSRTEEILFVCVAKRSCPLFHLKLLATRYSQFKAIRFRCSCRDTGLWFLLRKVPNIKEICFAAAPPIDLYQRIKLVDIVRLVRNRYAWDLIGHFGQNVTELGPTLMDGAPQGSMLEQCPRLETLDCMLANGAEKAFENFTKTFTSLRVLKLSLFPKCSCFCASFGSSSPANTVPYTIPGTILSLVTRAPNIAELELRQIFVGVEEQVEILKLLGNRLTKFSCNIRYDGVRGFRYLGAVLKALRQYNPRVTESHSSSLVFSGSAPSVEMFMER